MQEIKHSVVDCATVEVTLLVPPVGGQLDVVPCLLIQVKLLRQAERSLETLAADEAKYAEELVTQPEQQ